ncbi:OPT oligopeptide transporter protein-domain-containing protein [Protomyces lactucae-debilis]|uniref:OPT oligopeptide transporter protein-domain-containing protein n=1 Tax=Protomyces lactucae-debilis TaxID=2754530 RepID=A0A1Y2F961_PROLT|nr:OPT oligopeptide transporter protein-domain-containing protein [Protomyces lactucae-debilis]ORY79876.1 OPT oligopeptide transporter protein-domain-containing protein [Protomyces lactucae-debilis]
MATSYAPLVDPLGSVRSYGAAISRRTRTASMDAQRTLRETPSIINFHPSRRTKPRSQSESYEAYEPLRRQSLATSVASSDNAEEALLKEGALLLDDSPYAEVRACVSNQDDHTLQADTMRMWCLALAFVVTGSAVNLFFSLRFPAVAITALLAQLLSHPIGIAWTRYMPDITIPLIHVRVNDPDHPWNVKEHTCVFVAANVSFAFAFATDVLTEQIKFYGMKPSLSYSIALVISTQVIGYTFAGLTRHWLVTPSSMIWPATLVNCALFQVLHPQRLGAGEHISLDSQSTTKEGGLTRTRFFVLLCGAAFLWAFVPSFFVPGLSYFGIVTWFFPKQKTINTIFGVRSGMGILPFTFDWAQISFTGSPILVPAWAALNALFGVACMLWIMAPLLYFTNSFGSAFLPFADSNVFDNTAQHYNVSRIITPEVTFSKEAYEAYSPLYLTASYIMSYVAAFASLSALVVHCYLFYKDDIIRQWQASKTELSSRTGDVHSRLMRRYPDVDNRAYLAIFVLCLLLALWVVAHEFVGLPWYGLLLALCLCGVFFVPTGIISAIAAQNTSTALLCQLICGVVFPGRPIANLVFLNFGYVSGMQGIRFASDMKIGAYMKIPPRLLFKVQLIATLLGSLVQVGVLKFLLASVPNICTMDAPNGLTCPIARIHFNSSIIWGLIGPGRLFGRDALYRPIMYAFALGAILPIPIYYMSRRSKGKDSVWNYCNVPVMLSAMTWVPPAGGLNFSSWALVGYLSNHVLKRRRPDLWGKYNFVASAALDMGLASALVVGFFSLVYTNVLKDYGLEFGKQVYKQTCDWQGCTRLPLPERGFFGRDVW